MEAAAESAYSGALPDRKSHHKGPTEIPPFVVLFDDIKEKVGISKTLILQGSFLQSMNLQYGTTMQFIFLQCLNYQNSGNFLTCSRNN